MAPTKSALRTRLAASSGAGAVAAALLVSAAPAAHGADPAELCSSHDPDSTYTVVANSAAIPEGRGTVYLFYNPDSGNNCAVTIGTVTGATYMDVGLQHHPDTGVAAQWAYGTYSQHTDPVVLHAPGICIDFTGAVGDRSVTVTNVNCGE